MKKFFGLLLGLFLVSSITASANKIIPSDQQHRIEVTDGGQPYTNIRPIDASGNTTGVNLPVTCNNCGGSSAGSGFQGVSTYASIGFNESCQCFKMIFHDANGNTNDAGHPISVSDSAGNNYLAAIQTALSGVTITSMPGGGSATAALQSVGITNTSAVVTALSGVTIATSALPSGASTSALQTTGNTSLGTIATNSGTQATAALQTTGNTSLGTIATNTGNIPSKGPVAHINSLPVNMTPVTMTGASIASTNGSDVFPIYGYSQISVELVGSSWADAGGSKVIFLVSNDGVTWQDQTTNIYRVGTKQVNGINATNTGNILDLPFAGGHSFLSVSCTAITSGSFVPVVTCGIGSQPLFLPDTFTMAGSSKSNGTVGSLVLATGALYDNANNNNVFTRDSSTLTRFAGTTISTGPVTIFTPAAGKQVHINSASFCFDTTGTYTMFDSAGATLDAWFVPTGGTCPPPHIYGNQCKTAGVNNTITMTGPTSGKLFGVLGTDNQ